MLLEYSPTFTPTNSLVMQESMPHVEHRINTCWNNPMQTLSQARKSPLPMSAAPRNSSDFGFGTWIGADSKLSYTPPISHGFCSNSPRCCTVDLTGETIFPSTWPEYTNIEKPYQALPSAKLDPCPEVSGNPRNCPSWARPLYPTWCSSQTRPPTQPYMGCKIRVQTSSPKHVRVMNSWILHLTRIWESNHHISEPSQ